MPDDIHKATPWEVLHKTKNTKGRSEEHTSELQSQSNLVCRLLLEKKNLRLAEDVLIITNGRVAYRRPTADLSDLVNRLLPCDALQYDGVVRTTQHPSPSERRAYTV